MDNRRYEIYLGALLHDIGKFYQRADDSFNKSNELKSNVKNLSYLTNTTQHGYPTHQHAYWTMQFLENKSSIIEKLNFSKGENDIFNLASYHHRPNNEVQAFIQLADWWASGIDRSSIDEEKLVAHNQKEAYKKVPMVSIFSSLKINKQQTKDKSYKVQPLTIEKIFPDIYSDENLNTQLKYRDLWDVFSKEFDDLPIYSLDAFSISLYYLLKKYLWFIPASTIDYPESSLFQHSKLTAAFAQCFYDFQVDSGNTAFQFDKIKNKLVLQKDMYPVLLLGVDLSGIQGFIYNISSKFAAKSLRGRSFYIQMVMESICWNLIHETLATPSHIVYNSGGKFFMVLPNTDFIHQKLESFFNNIEKNLWKKHEGR